MSAAWSNRARIIANWAAAAVLVLGLLAMVARPMAIAWRCYALNASGERAEAAVVKKLARAPSSSSRSPRVPRPERPARRTPRGATTRRSRSANRSRSFTATDRPGECVLVATLENSALVLWAFTGAIAIVVLLILWAGVRVHRSYTATAFLTSYLDVDVKDMTCPQCGAEMAEGYLALLAGLHWRGIDEPIGMPHALGGLPGTVGWRARPRLHGFRCEPCSIVTFKYGTNAAPR